MFDVTHKYKSECVLFATVRLDGDHPIYLSAYGELASILLERYVEDQRADNEDLFAEWDESLQEASSQLGFEACHQVEGGYVYITTYQSGIGIASGDEAEPTRRTARRGPEISILRADLGEEEDEEEDEQ